MENYVPLSHLQLPSRLEAGITKIEKKATQALRGICHRSERASDSAEPPHRKANIQSVEIETTMNNCERLCPHKLCNSISEYCFERVKFDRQTDFLAWSIRQYRRRVAARFSFFTLFFRCTLRKHNNNNNNRSRLSNSEKHVLTLVFSHTGKLLDDASVDGVRCF